jgi:hypothetical protein
MKLWGYLVNVLFIMFVPGYQLVDALLDGESELAAAWFMTFCAIACVSALMIAGNKLSTALRAADALNADLIKAARETHDLNRRAMNAMVADHRVRSIEFFNAEQQATWN